MMEALAELRRGIEPMAADHVKFSELATLIIGLIALVAGTRIRQMVPVLKRIDMPNAVIGAMIVAPLVLLAQVMFGTEVAFGTKLRDLLLLVFFTTIGLSAKLKAPRAGGRPLVILCAVTVAGLPESGWHRCRDGLGCTPTGSLLGAFPSLVGQERHLPGRRRRRA
ncbi:sodium/glutamate symporter [Mesorhizobium waimense]